MVDIAGIVCRMRSQRMKMVQTVVRLHEASGINIVDN